MVLNNMTRSTRVVKMLIELKTSAISENVDKADDSFIFHKLVDILTSKNFNPKGKYDYLANVIFNVTQVPDARKLIMAKSGQGIFSFPLLYF